MAERKSGPVKPPVIDLTVRSVHGSDKPKSGDRASTAAPKPHGQTRPNRPATSEAGKASATGTAKSGTAPGTGGAGDAPGRAGSAARLGPGGSSPQTSSTDPDSPLLDPGRPQSPPPRTAAAATAAQAAATPDAAEGGSERANLAQGDAPATPGTATEPINLWPAVGGAVLAGAVLGALLSYGVAAMGWLPTLPSPEQSAAMASLSNRVSALESKIGEASSTDTAAIQKLQQTVNQLQSAPAPQQADLGPVQTQLKTLSSRLDALNTGPSSADAGAISASVKQLQQSMSALSDKTTANLKQMQQSVSELSDKTTAVARQQSSMASTVSGLSNAVSGLSDTTDALGQQIDRNKSALAQQVEAAARQKQSDAVKLPLLVSSLEEAFSTGSPYAEDLKSLNALAPDIAVPASVAAAAASGLPRAPALHSELENAMPAILSAAPTPANASWTDKAASWLRGVLAIRPAGETAGTSPDALVSRIEAAIDRGDYAAASGLMDELPGPMRAAAGDLPAQLKAGADARALLDTVRARALQSKGAGS